MKNRFRRPLILSMAVLGISAFTPNNSSAQSADLTSGQSANRSSGAVFIMTNDADKNEVIAFDRAANGSLTEANRYNTGGRGSGGTTDPLESQGSLTFSQDHSLLFVANAGSGTVSVFKVLRSNLALIEKAPSGGSQPVAVAQFNNLVYVLNSGGSGSLVGFHLGFGGQLQQIKNSTAFLSGNATGGASLAFSPDGQFLLVTERVANTIDAFRVQPDGTLGPIVLNANPAPGTFSLAFAPNGKAVVSETGPAGGSNASATSSYSVGADGKLTAVSQSVPAFGNGNCWNAITPDGTRVYTSNSASSSISGYNIAKDGTLTPIGATVVGNNPPGSINLDIAVTADGRYLYSIDSGSGNVGIFRIEQDGTLTNLGQAGDLPKSVGFNGIAAI
ncbi:lactonase family protein [Edaphobacter aggregans]|uniref:lactonase family protein n=1 Tax=Edaphobacter aggregans TaxID=570835 RepID=UPI000A05426D|nr:beta-propeller fold lactonase family protein [Edaphobacter aggregans]